MESLSKHLDGINKILFDFNLKSIIYMNPFSNEQPTNSVLPCFAFACKFEYTLPLLIAASRIASKCAFCCLEPDWLQLENGELYLSAGICMDNNSQAYFYHFEKPLMVTLYINFYIYPSVWTSSQRIDFLNLELSSKCPKSSSFLLASYTNDKLYTRILASEYDVPVPDYVAFCFDTTRYDSLQNNGKILQISKDVCDEKVLGHIHRHLNSDKLVIKPSGRSWMGSKNVFFVEINDSLSIMKAFRKCLEEISDEDSILVDEFIDSELPTQECKHKLGNRIRVYASRCSNGTIETTGIVCNIGALSSSISGVSSQSFSLDYLLDLFDYSDTYKNRIEAEIKLIGKNTLKAIIDKEAKINIDTVNSQTDFIGLDLVLSRKTNGREIFLLEVNDHESISAFACYELVNFPERSKMLDKWVNTMIHRSYDYMLSKKSILILDDCNIYTFKSFLNANGVNFMLLEAKGILKQDLDILQYFYDYNDGEKNVEEHAKCTACLIKNSNFIPDKIITFNDEHNSLVQKIREIFHIESIDTAPNRSFTLYKNFNFNYDIKSYKLESTDNYSEIEFPILLKSINQVKAFEIISSNDELLSWRDQYSLNDAFTLYAEAYIFGPTYHAVIMIYERELIFFNVHEPIQKERFNHVQYSIHDICLKKNLETGIFLFKVIFSIQGIKLLKIEPFEKVQMKNEKYFNSHIDFAKYFFLMACKIKLIKF